jgi:hypothetical protein
LTPPAARAAALGLTVWSCAGAEGGLQVDVSQGPDAPAADNLRLDWLDADRFLIRGLRVPPKGTLDPAATPLARIRIEAEGSGPRRVVVRGLFGDDVVSEGVGMGRLAGNGWTIIPVTLTAGRRPDLDQDGVPDEIDGCPDDATVVGPCAGSGGGADGGAPVQDARGGKPGPAEVSISSIQPPPTFDCGAALLVVGKKASNSGDRAMIDRLAGMTCTVALADDALVMPADATGKSVVVISEGVMAVQLGNRLREIAAGVVVMHPEVLGLMSFNGTRAGTDWDFGTSAGPVQIVGTAHPLAAGLSGAVPLFSDAVSVGWANPDGAAAIHIVALDASAMRFLVFAYDKGTLMSGGFAAPGRRVALPVSRDAVLKLNSQGWSIFDAAVRWASGH